MRGKVVLVTGAASGMGRAIAHLFADEGARVAVTDRAPDDVGVVVDEIVAAGGDAAGWVLDVAEPEVILRVVDEVVARLGPIGVLVSDAGISVPVEIAADDFEPASDATLAVNLTAQVGMIRACQAHLARDGPTLRRVGPYYGPRRGRCRT